MNIAGVNTKSGMYTVKSGYWVEMNLFREETLEIQEPNTTKLQAFALKIKAPPKSDT